VIDQFIQAPIFTVLIFAFLGLLEGKTLDSIQKQLEDDYQDTMIANCTWKDLRLGHDYFVTYCTMICFAIAY
jgi:hypothetical protein